MRSFVLCVATLALAGTALADSISLTGTIRDFNDTHPDMESTIAGIETGRVLAALGGDNKPVPAFVNAPSGSSFSTASNFNQWYNNVPGVNMAASLSLTLDETAPGSGVYRYSNNSFFPIDNQLLGNQGRGHNYHFTFELHSAFTYMGGETFSFTGDDDLWVFINGQRVIDLGGVHSAASASVDLDTLGLVIGNTYNFDLFFAERHTTQSNFTMETSIELMNIVPLPTGAWIGLAGLVGVGGFKAARRRKH